MKILKNKLNLIAYEAVDVRMINESYHNYIGIDVDYKDKRCLDLGGNVGGFTKIALNGGAISVDTVDCDKRNFKILEENFKNYPNVNLYHGAISNSYEQTIKLYKANNGNSHCGTSINVKTHRFKEYDEVRNYNIDIFLENTYDIIKIDIEGAE
jgi:FkbM family methyltransferase